MITGTIYALVAPNLNIHYIGSSINNVISRISTHKTQYRNWLRTGGVTSCCCSKEIFRDIDWDYKILKIGQYDSERDLRKEEYQYALNSPLDSLCINKNSAGGIEDMKEYQTRYRKRKRDVMIHCECGIDVKYYSLSGHLSSKRHLKGVKK